MRSLSSTPIAAPRLAMREWLQWLPAVASKTELFTIDLLKLAQRENVADGERNPTVGEPLYYLHGFHNVVVGLEKALEGKKIGDAIEITLHCCCCPVLAEMICCSACGNSTLS